MGLLKENDKKAISQQLAGLTGPVKIINFTQEFECNYCSDTAALVSEVAELSDKISFESYDFLKDKEVADKYKIDKIPATVITGEDDSGIRFFGIPSGYEFVSLLEAIKIVSSGDSGLDTKTKEMLGKLKQPLHLQVFVTPT